MVESNYNLPILLVEDEPEALAMLESLLRRHGFPNLVPLDSGHKAIAFLEQNDVALIVLDLQLPGFEGLDLLKLLAAKNPLIPIIIVTGENQLEIAIECMKNGAVDYLTKPISIKRLSSGIKRALEMRGINEEIQSMRSDLAAPQSPVKPEGFSSIITRNREMLALLRYVEIIANSFQPILITGETGVGKELVARAVHNLSGRNGAYVCVNVAGLDDQMFSDTMFGHLKGAYTGAMQNRDGLVKKAASGTLFLDEIGDLNELSQIKLLRLLQENEYFQLGSDIPQQNRARLVVATNQNLKGLMMSGKFRKDLYYRLCSHQVTIPSLRKRVDDIPVLFEHFVKEAASAMGKGNMGYRQELVDLLSLYDFPGNVRELQAMVLDVVARSSGSRLPIAPFKELISREKSEGHLEMVLQDGGDGAPFNGVSFAKFPTLKHAETVLITRALKIANGNQGIAAQLLGITRQALNNRLRRSSSAGYTE
jgi:DNA-binding NtrC family response regulator